MTAYAATGPEHLPDRDTAEDVITGVLRHLSSPPSRFVSGAAAGVDTYFALLARLLYPDVPVTLLIPGSERHNDQLVATFRVNAIPGDVIIIGPQLKTTGETMMARNDLIISNCDVLLAFPRTLHETVRSGTWATIRRARKADRPYRLTSLTD